jgi:outer membrane protein, adhesin transport system
MRAFLKLLFAWMFIHAGLLQSVAGQPVHLHDCIAIGLERNFSVLLARNYEEIAANNFSRGNAGFLPGIEMRAQQSGTLYDTEQTFVDGGSQRSSGDFSTSSNAGINMALTLFDGFRIQTTYNKLEAQREIGMLNTRLEIENLVARIASEYYNLIQQQRQLENLRYSVELSKERVRIDEERYLIGSGSKLQLLQAEVFLNADSSRLGRQYEEVRASRIRLNELMAMDDLNAQLIPHDTVIVVDPGLAYEQLLNSAMENNTVLHISSRNSQLAEFDKKIVASHAYPYLALHSGYGYTYSTFQSGNLDAQSRYGLNYGLTLTFNIFDGHNQRRRESNAAIEVDNRRLVYESTEKNILAELLTIYNAYQNNLRLLELEIQNLEVARETLDIAMERYRLGALSGIELREVQKNLLEAEERLLSIQYRTKMAEISLRQIAGKIMIYV